MVNIWLMMVNNDGYPLVNKHSELENGPFIDDKHDDLPVMIGPDGGDTLW